VEDEDESLPDLDTQSESSSFTATNDELDFVMHRSRHWSQTIYAHTNLLQKRIETALTAAFETSPSLALYSTLLSITQDSRQLEKRLLEYLQATAKVSSDTYAVALEIYALEHKVNDIIDLLDSHSHLLRPRDFAALQSATILISNHGHGQRALQILQAELLDVVRMLRSALLQSFSLMEEPAHRVELMQIIKMPRGATGRRARVESWVDTVTTPGVGAPNPMMFAALFMGMPGVPGTNNDDDQYTYLDIDPHDPDLEDLRAEFRPNLKKRFESWVDVALQLKGGQSMLLNTYKKIIDTLPFLRAPDATEEMMAWYISFDRCWCATKLCYCSQLQDRPSKQWVCDGLDALLAFVKVNRRKWHAAAKAEAEKKKEVSARDAATVALSGASLSSASTPRATSSTVKVAGSVASSSSTIAPSTPCAESPGLPPLEPAPAPNLPPPPAAPFGPTAEAELDVPPPLTASVDTVLTGLPQPAPAPSAVEHNAVTLVNLLIGGAPQLGLAPQDHGPRSAIDDVD
jgi:hypothetical protein